MIADLGSERADAQGQSQTRFILTRWITTNAEAVQTASRISTLYEKVPVEVEFELDEIDGDYWVGDVFYLQCDQIVAADGSRDNARLFLVTSAEDVEFGHSVRYTAEDATLGGFISFIASDSQPDHTGNAEIDQLYGFITDADGLAGDGTPGSRIT